MIYWDLYVLGPWFGLYELAKPLAWAKISYRHKFWTDSKLLSISFFDSMLDVRF